MAKFHGNIGFAEQTAETAPGVYINQPVIREYTGELLRNRRQTQSSDGVNDNLSIMNEISIVADPYANENFFAMKYVEFMGTRWEIKSVEVVYPRLILTIGGVYNG